MTYSVYRCVQCNRAEVSLPLQNGPWLQALTDPIFDKETYIQIYEPGIGPSDHTSIDRTIGPFVCKRQRTGEWFCLQE